MLCFKVGNTIRVDTYIWYPGNRGPNKSTAAKIDGEKAIFEGLKDNDDTASQATAKTHPFENIVQEEEIRTGDERLEKDPPIEAPKTEEKPLITPSPGKLQNEEVSRTEDERLEKDTPIETPQQIDKPSIITPAELQNGDVNKKEDERLEQEPPIEAPQPRGAHSIITPQKQVAAKYENASSEGEN